MKKIALAIILMAFMVSCQKEVLTENNGTNSITATIINNDTKTYFDASEEGPTYQLYWSAGDKIKIFNTDGDAFIYTVASSVTDNNKSTTATFTPDSEGLTGTFACAYYPADGAIHNWNAAWRPFPPPHYWPEWHEFFRSRL